jgi:hypothetical protein
MFQNLPEEKQKEVYSEMTFESEQVMKEMIWIKKNIWKFREIFTGNHYQNLRKQIRQECLFLNILF